MGVKFLKTFNKKKRNEKREVNTHSSLTFLYRSEVTCYFMNTDRYPGCAQLEMLKMSGIFTDMEA